MFTESAELYDAIYSGLKDYGTEVNHIARLLGAEHPAVRTVLDVGCGTGEHARLLQARGFRMDGLDLDSSLLRIATAKNPESHFHHADMCAFNIGRRYDAVLCLFSSIGYARTIDKVIAALVCFRSHLADSGIVVVEPWFSPESFRTGQTTMQTVDLPSLRITRAGRSTVDDRISRVTFEYEIISTDGTKHASEIHELGLFTTDEMREAFSSAGLSVSYDEHGLTGRGLYIGRALP